MYATTLTDCLGVPRQRADGLSGIPESAFAMRIGTAAPYARTLADAVTSVYVRVNYNRNVEASGRLPAIPTVYYSKALVQDVMDAYRRLAGTGTVKHLTPDTIAAASATDTYSQVASTLLPKYPAISIDATRRILREWFYATIDGKILPSLILPAAQRYPTSGADALFALEEGQRAVQDRQKELEQSTFFGRIGAAITNLVSAPGELASAATTTATVAGVGAVVLGVGVVGTIVWTITSKVRQLDVNRAYGETHKTIRRVGPDVAAATIRKGR